MSRRHRYGSGWCSVTSASIMNPTRSPSASMARSHGTTGAPLITSGNRASAYELAIGEMKRRWVGWVRMSSIARAVAGVISTSRTSSGGPTGRSRHAA